MATSRPTHRSYIPEYEPRSSPVGDAHEYAPSSEDEDEVGGLLIASSRKSKSKRAAAEGGSGSGSAKKQGQMGHGKERKCKRRKWASVVSFSCSWLVPVDPLCELGVTP